MSLSANADASLAAVQAVVGHSNPAMTRHYLHADQDVVKTAVGLLPDVSGTADKKKGAHAPSAKLKAVLSKLDGLTDDELSTLGSKVQELEAKRKTEHK